LDSQTSNFYRFDWTLRISPKQTQKKNENKKFLQTIDEDNFIKKCQLMETEIWKISFLNLNDLYQRHIKTAINLIQEQISWIMPILLFFTWMIL